MLTAGLWLLEDAAEAVLSNAPLLQHLSHLMSERLPQPTSKAPPSHQLQAFI